MRNEEILRKVTGERNIVNTVKSRKDNWTGHMLRNIVHTANRRKDNWTGHMFRNIVHTVKRRKDKWTGHMLFRNCLLKRKHKGKYRNHGKKRRRRRRQLLDNLKETRGYWKLQEEELDCPLCRTRFGKIIQTCRKTDYRTTN